MSTVQVETAPVAAPETGAEQAGPVLYVVALVDESGSMNPLADDVCGGFNSYIDSLSGLGGSDLRPLVTLVTFADRPKHVCWLSELADVPKLTDRTYRPGGLTALHDAVGSTLHRFREEIRFGPDDRAVLVVSTDGFENASTEYEAETVKAMVEELDRSDRWTLLYLGAGPAAWRGGDVIGMRSVNTVWGREGTRATYSAMTAATYAAAAGRSSEDVSRAFEDEVTRETTG